MSNDTCFAYGQRHSERGQLRSVSLIARRSHAARCVRPDGISALLAGKVETDCANRPPRRDNHDSYGGCAGTWRGADLGCGRCDLDRFADCRGSRYRLEAIRIDEPTSYEILTYVDRGTSVRDCERQGSTRPAAISNGRVRDPPADRAPPAPLLRINRWKETADMHRYACGIELILPDWLYTGVLDDALVLTIDRAYFDLIGRFECWLVRLLRKHGRRQTCGWSFDFVNLHAKSGSRSPLKHFAYDPRQFVRRQTSPAYRLVITRDTDGVERSNFAPLQVRPLCRKAGKVRAHLKAGGKPVNCIVLSRTRIFVPSAAAPSYYRERKSLPRVCCAIAFQSPNSANPQSLGLLITGQIRSSAIGKVTAAKIQERRRPPAHDSHSAAANVITAICRKISACWRGPETSVNKGAAR